jgi:hypothetical protein
MQATLGKALSFDGSEEVVCDLSEKNRNGIQVVADGFDLADATVTIVSAMGVETEVSDIEADTFHALIGEKMLMKKIKIDGLSTGDYKVTFMQ